VFHQFFPAIAAIYELRGEFLGVNLTACNNVNRSCRSCAWPETLQESANAGNDDFWAVAGSGESPEDFHSAPHGLNGRAHSLKRQGFPGREEQAIVTSEKLDKVIVQPSGVSAGWARDDERCSFRKV
jgi:hypothetical protein